MPFLAENLWQTLVRQPCADAPDSVHLAGWPETPPADETVLEEMAAARSVVELGRQARSASGVKLRQPLPRLVVEGATVAEGLAGEIRDELRVKELELGHVESELRVKPHLPALGPRLGKELGAVRAALQAGEFEEVGDGRFRVLGHELGPEEVLVERSGRDGWAVAADGGVTVALHLSLDDGLLREGRVNELVHRVNSLRKEAGLDLTDRIRLTIPSGDADLLAHADWIKAETLAVSLEADGGSEPAIAKVS